MDAELGYVYEAIKLTRETIENRIPIYGFCGGPWTVMTYMIEGGGSKAFAKSKGWVYAHPEATNELLDLITTTSIKCVPSRVDLTLHGSFCVVCAAARANVLVWWV